MEWVLCGHPDQHAGRAFNPPVYRDHIPVRRVEVAPPDVGVLPQMVYDDGATSVFVAPGGARPIVFASLPEAEQAAAGNTKRLVAVQVQVSRDLSGNVTSARIIPGAMMVSLPPKQIIVS